MREINGVFEAKYKVLHSPRSGTSTTPPTPDWQSVSFDERRQPVLIVRGRLLSSNTASDGLFFRSARRSRAVACIGHVLVVSRSRGKQSITKFFEDMPRYNFIERLGYSKTVRLYGRTLSKDPGS